MHVNSIIQKKKLSNLKLVHVEAITKAKTYY